MGVEIGETKAVMLLDDYFDDNDPHDNAAEAMTTFCRTHWPLQRVVTRDYTHSAHRDDRFFV